MLLERGEKMFIAVKLNVKFMTDGKWEEQFSSLPTPLYIRFLLILKNVVHDKKRNTVKYEDTGKMGAENVLENPLIMKCERNKNTSRRCHRGEEKRDVEWNDVKFL